MPPTPPPTHPSPSKPLITIRPRRQPEDLLPLTHLLQTVYDRDAYPVQGTADAAGFLTQPSTLRAWVAETSSATSSSSADGEEKGERRGQIVGHVAVSRPRAEDAAVKLWRELHPQRGSIGSSQEEEEGEEQPIALLERLFIHPSVRNHGLASSLLRTAEEWAAAHPTTIALPEEGDSSPQASPKQQKKNPEKQNKRKKGIRLLLFALAKDENAMRLYRRRGWEEFGRTGFGWDEEGPSAPGGEAEAGGGEGGEKKKGKRNEMEAICFVSPLAPASPSPAAAAPSSSPSAPA
ncbi:hypothetical protein KC343_g6598 [Hortaea werneckii]|nr:hypothetical protein KC352_g13869 [Hortaea werneckii]KAI7564881.1 hypothetical protein KC317_g6747 [Hortaea werneckii]KAI7615073.1 hypothetical protein KC346_g6645 [Hortaea werneckii]KAI7625611.1 hypothetical protein KC343_g6598 [Hortaea werneckii]KAI7681443.1 hypothetical protein KC319_g1582 [Hortaea werneckii]